MLRSLNMPDPEPLLFEADLPKFMEVALIEDVGRRSDMLQANPGLLREQLAL